MKMRETGLDWMFSSLDSNEITINKKVMLFLSEISGTGSLEFIHSSHIPLSES